MCRGAGRQGPPVVVVLAQASRAQTIKKKGYLDTEFPRVDYGY